MGVATHVYESIHVRNTADLARPQQNMFWAKSLKQE